MSGKELPGYPANWGQMTREEKRAWRLDQWRSSAEVIDFVSPEAKANYKTRLERLIAVFSVEEPDRVPVYSAAGLLPLKMAGVDYYTAIREPEKAVEACREFNEKYAEELDGWAATSYSTIPARALELLGLKIYAFPGYGMPDTASNFQFVEGEYMRADEYDVFLEDPSDFWLRTYLPRVFGVFEPLATSTRLTDIWEIIQMQLPGLVRPDIQQMLERLLAAARELTHYYQVMGQAAAMGMAMGHPAIPFIGFAKAPYDVLGDTLRGTKGVLMDMLRQPDKLLAAMDRIADLMIKGIVESPQSAQGLVVIFPLHKGADGWMSEQQFLKFYWPPLKKVVSALAEEGILCWLFAEGSYETRIDLVNEFPKAAVCWQFDRTDMARAKQILGKDCALIGNVPSSLLVTGSPEEVKELCRRLIEVCAPGGGYYLGAGAVAEFPKLENLKAMADAAREYGVYRR